MQHPRPGEMELWLKSPFYTSYPVPPYILVLFVRVLVMNVNSATTLLHPLKIATGCLAISVKSETPLFSDIYRGSRLFFHVVIGYCAGFDFLKKNLKFFFGSGSGPGTTPAWFSGSAWFAASSSSCSLQVFNFLV